MGKGSKKGKTYAKASRKAASQPVKGANNTHMTRGRLATERQEHNHQHQEVMEVTTPMKLLLHKGKYFRCHQISCTREIEG
jgi:hypothetical protein